MSFKPSWSSLNQAGSKTTSQETLVESTSSSVAIHGAVGIHVDGATHFFWPTLRSVFLGWN